MKRMCVLGGVALWAALSASGCCWWADRWCPQRGYPSAYAAPAYAPAQPVCCQPCVPVCAPGQTTGYPTQQSWSRPSNGNCQP